LFDLLKEKLSSFVENFSKKEEENLAVKISLESRLKGTILGEVEIQEKDISSLMDELELSLIEADVALEVALEITSSVKKNLIGKKIKIGSAKEAVKEAIKEALAEQLKMEKPDLLTLSDLKKPFKIILLGPNGAGKTTTMAKLADLFMRSGKTVVLSAGDSFRAAAIEQAEIHGKKLGITVIKHAYGADPAAVCFDAVNYATARGIDVVIMDTAGRQETNKNLVDEMKKIVRIVKPDMKIFVGESIAGNALLDQVRSFKEAAGVDAVVLTKFDCDAKGGSALSLIKGAGVPVIFLGVGQEYADLIEFDEKFILSQVLGF